MSKAKILIIDDDEDILETTGELWKFEGTKTFYGVRDYSYSESERKKVLKIPNEYNYLNTGVLLIDCKKWRKIHATKKIVDYAEKNGKLFLAPDQDAINGSLHKESGLLPPYWNFSLPTYRSDDPTQLNKMCEKDKIELKKRPRLIHFISIKPWKYESAHPFKKEYQKYFSRTPWALTEIPEINIKFTLRLRKLVDYVKYCFPKLWSEVLKPSLNLLKRIQGKWT